MRDSDKFSSDINILLELTTNGHILHYTVFKYGNCKRIRESEALDALNQATQCPKCMTELIVNVFVPTNASYYDDSQEDVGKESIELVEMMKEETIEPVTVEKVEYFDDYEDESEVVASNYIENGEMIEIEVEEPEQMEVETLEPDYSVQQGEYVRVEYLYDDAGELMKQDKEVTEVWECELCNEQYPSKQSLSSHKRRHPELRLPTYCTMCDRHFEKGAFWKKHMEVYHSEEPRPQKLLKTTQACSLCGVELANMGEIKKHMKDMHSDAPRFYCDHCSKSYLSKKHVRDHLMRKHFGHGTSFVCGICDPPKEFLTKLQLDQHFRSAHTAEEIELKKGQHTFFKREWRNDLGDFSCPRCLRIFNNRYSLGIHYVHCSRKTDPVGQIPTCEICNKTFTTWAKVKSHILDVHEKRRRFTCEKCGQGFSHKGHWQNHLELHEFDDPKPYKCPVKMCGKGFKVKKQIDKHIALKHQPIEIRPYVCEKCQPEKRFLCQRDLQHHDKLVHTEKSLPCPHCPMMFKIEQQRKTHIRNIHVPEDAKPKYSCDQCNYSSSMKACYQSHLRQHQPKPFICSLCEKGFVSAELLKRHELIHSDTRPFQCDICQKRFRHRADLTTHYRLHTGEKPYQCQLCEKRYSDRGCFRSHLLSHERQLGVVLEKSVKKTSETATKTEVAVEEEVELS